MRNFCTYIKVTVFFTKQDYHSRDPGSMTAMLQELSVPSLGSRRGESRLCQMFKISYGMIPAIPPGDIASSIERELLVHFAGVRVCG